MAFNHSSIYWNPQCAVEKIVSAEHCLVCCYWRAAKAHEAAFVPEVEEDEDMPQAAEPAPVQVANGTTAKSEQRAGPPNLAQPAHAAAAAGPAAAHVPEPEQALAQPPPKEEPSSLHRLAPEAPDSGNFGLQVRFLLVVSVT